MKLFLTLILATLLGACGYIATKKGDELLSRSSPGDWGVLDVHHEAKEKSIILSGLKDPNSATFRFNVARNISHTLGDPVLAWYSWVYVNAKNSYGGYTGEQLYAFVYICPVNQSCTLINSATPNSTYPTELDWAK